jgi:hypothetical protein
VVTEASSGSGLNKAAQNFQSIPGPNKCLQIQKGTNKHFITATAYDKKRELLCCYQKSTKNSGKLKTEHRKPSIGEQKHIVPIDRIAWHMENSTKGKKASNPARQIKQTGISRIGPTLHMYRLPAQM